MAIASALKARGPEDAVFAWIGGDEFAILSHRVDDPDTAMELAECFASDARRDIPFQDRALGIGGSVGAVMAASVSRLAEALMAAADVAMYAAKRDPSAATALFDPSMAEKRATLIDREHILAALADGRIVPFYQPKVPLVTGELVRCEALARWIGHKGEIKGPGAFLHKINSLGLQADFTQKMMEAAHSEACRWQSFGSPIGVAINLEEETLIARSGVEILEWAIDNFPEIQGRITLEITEDDFVARSLGAIKAAL